MVKPAVGQEMPDSIFSPGHFFAGKQKAVMQIMRRTCFARTKMVHMMHQVQSLLLFFRQEIFP